LTTDTRPLISDHWFSTTDILPLDGAQSDLIEDINPAVQAISCLSGDRPVFDQYLTCIQPAFSAAALTWVGVVRCLEEGSSAALVKNWSNTDPTLVKTWSKTGPTLVKHWSSAGQSPRLGGGGVVHGGGPVRDEGPLVLVRHPRAPELPVKHRSNTGQAPVKHRSNTSQTPVKHHRSNTSQTPAKQRSNTGLIPELKRGSKWLLKGKRFTLVVEQGANLVENGC
jgi:hypothetical protein